MWKMRFINTAWAATLLAVMVVGCEQRTVTRRPSSAAASNFQARLVAAREISNRSQRDAGLARVAQDAAGAAEGAVAKNAIEGMSSIRERDAAAFTAALALAQAGAMDHAVEVARMISSQSKRDEVLTRLAAGG